MLSLATTQTFSFSALPRSPLSPPSEIVLTIFVFFSAALF